MRGAEASECLNRFSKPSVLCWIFSRPRSSGSQSRVGALCTLDGLSAPPRPRADECCLAPPRPALKGRPCMRSSQADPGAPPWPTLGLAAAQATGREPPFCRWALNARKSRGNAVGWSGVQFLVHALLSTLIDVRKAPPGFPAGGPPGTTQPHNGHVRSSLAWLRARPRSLTPCRASCCRLKLLESCSPRGKPLGLPAEGSYTLTVPTPPRRGQLGRAAPSHEGPFLPAALACRVAPTAPVRHYWPGGDPLIHASKTAPMTHVPSTRALPNGTPTCKSALKAALETASV